jgi:hypothetical protein
MPLVDPNIFMGCSDYLVFDLQWLLVRTKIEVSKVLNFSTTGTNRLCSLGSQTLDRQNGTKPPHRGKYISQSQGTQ